MVMNAESMVISASVRQSVRTRAMPGWALTPGVIRSWRTAQDEAMIWPMNQMINQISAGQPGECFHRVSTA